MTYDFDKLYDRRNSGSVKWKVADGELPMWVADMDFPAAPEILEAVQARAAHGIWGYAYQPDEWYAAYQNWWAQRHGWQMEREWLSFCIGIVPAVSSVIRSLTQPGEKVLLQPPVYHVFYHCVENNGRIVVENPLQYDGTAYEMDFEDLERKLADPQVRLMLLCNPHNPVGKLWDRETLARVGALCKQHNVVVVSDEIHCDLTTPGCGYVPFAGIDETCRDNCVVCLAPTKTFNLAGLQTAAVAVPSEALRSRVQRAMDVEEISSANVFAIDAAIAAFTKGGPWLDALQVYLEANRQTVADFVAAEIPQAKLVAGTATYLLWLDCTSLEDKGDLAAFIRQKTGLFLSAGTPYGGNGKRCLRMNIACPRSTLLDGLKRLKTGLELYEQA